MREGSDPVRPRPTPTRSIVEKPKQQAMRTTLDIDDDILEAAKELARAERKTAGQVLSELARRGLTQHGAPAMGFAEEAAAPFVMKDGWYVLTNREGVVVTRELVDRLIEESDLEDAGLTKDDPSKGK
jgi:hypothetical protein